MKQEQSTASRSLKAVSIAIALVTLVTLATVGYSVYEAFALITTPNPGFDLSPPRLVATNLVLTVNGTVPNRGLYPIQIEWRYEARAQGVLLGQAIVSPVQLPPGKNTTFSERAELNLLGTNDVTALRNLLLNGESISVLGNGSFGLQPFVSLTVSSASSIEFPAPMGNFQIGSPSQSVVNGRQQLSLKVTFVDEASFGFPFGMYAEVYSDETLTANSTAASGQAAPGQTSLVSLVALASQQVNPGNYNIVIHILFAGKNIPVPAEVRI